MKTLLASLLVAAAGGSFAAAAMAAPSPDLATYRNMIQKAAVDYKDAVAKCASMSGTAKDICRDEAKVARARADADAVAQYNDVPKARLKARTALADADYALAKSRCADMSGADKDNCLHTARSTHTAALADAKADRQIAATTAAEKCAQVAGQPNTGCLIDNRAAGSSTTATTAAGSAVESAADKTRNAAATATEKTREAASKVADKTERAVDTVAAKSERAADKTSAAVSDSVITTKVKADIFKEPELKSMAIHVETEKGVVMLSGFVDSKADAEKAVKVARGVEGVTSVKSALKVK